MSTYTTWPDGTGTSLTRQPSEIRPSVTVVLHDSDEYILFQQRADNGWWGLPGGAIDIGESVYRAAAREVYEETGYHIDEASLWLTGIYSDPLFYTCSTYVDRTVHYVNMTFLVDMERHVYGRPRQSAESLQLAWRGPDAWPTPLMPSYALRLADALDNVRTGRVYPVIR